MTMARRLAIEKSQRYAADGVTARIILPISEPDRQGHPAAIPRTGRALSPLPHPAEEGCLKGKPIIIIEDEPLVAMDLQSTLTTAGCKAIGAVGTLGKARNLLADAEIDAALLDVNLSGHRVDEL